MSRSKRRQQPPFTIKEIHIIEELDKERVYIAPIPRPSTQRQTKAHKLKIALLIQQEADFVEYLIRQNTVITMEDQ